MSVSLQFPLVVEDDWPPVGSESLPFDSLSNGYKVLAPPLFVRDLSVHDIIDVSVDSGEFVSSWRHLTKSRRSVVWILRLSKHLDIEHILQAFRELGCNTTGVDAFGCYAIDIPESTSVAAVDDILDGIKKDDGAVAFPSFRHPE